MACLDGADGHVYWFRPGDTEPYGLLNSSLGQFVEVVNALYPEIAWRVIYLSPDAGEERVAAIRRGIEETMRQWSARCASWIRPRSTARC